MEGTDLFKSYESDFKIAYNEAQLKLNKIQLLSGDERSGTMKEVEQLLDECYDIIDQLNLEVQNISSVNRSSFNAKVRSYRNDLDGVKSNLKKYMDDLDRQILFNGQNYDDMTTSQRQALLSSNASLERSSNRLKDSSRIALETENVGASILNDLRGQREQIVNSRNTLLQADGYVDRSMQTLKTMTRRLAANKLITYCIIAVLIVLIFLVLVSKFW